VLILTPLVGVGSRWFRSRGFSSPERAASIVLVAAPWWHEFSIEGFYDGLLGFS